MSAAARDILRGASRRGWSRLASGMHGACWRAPDGAAFDLYVAADPNRWDWAVYRWAAPGKVTGARSRIVARGHAPTKHEAMLAAEVVAGRVGA